VRSRARSGITRRLGHLEDALGAEPKCKCRVWIEDVAKPWSQTIVLAHAGGDDSEVCGDCGGKRVVLVVHHGFPLTKCECGECTTKPVS
jgi:hypothetical protein